MERELTHSPVQDQITSELPISLLEITSDPEFKEYFKQLQQVFLYVTDRCNLGCEQCLYKPLLRQGEEFRFDVAVRLLAEFRRMGADKLSLLGGEPTTYLTFPN